MCVWCPRVCVCVCACAYVCIDKTMAVNIIIASFRFYSSNYPGDKAVDCLMESKWTTEPSDKHDSLVPYFETRTNAVDYCSR